MPMVIQIAALAGHDGPNSTGYPALVALRDDGSLWLLPRPLDYPGASEWRQMTTPTREAP